MARTSSNQLLLSLVVALSCTLCGEASAEVVGSTQWSGKNYYVDVQNRNGTATVWLRLRKNASSTGDINALTLNYQSTTINAARKLCSAKKFVDKSKMVVGCASSVGTGVCALTGGGAGVGMVVCGISAQYAAQRGFRDCINGMSDEIASYLRMQNEWRAFAAGNSISMGNWADAIDRGIDAACDDPRLR